MIDLFLDTIRKSRQKVLLSYNSVDMSPEFFLERYNLYRKQISLLENYDNRSACILYNENPLEFYPLLFAMIHRDIPVVFPTRDYMEGKLSFECARYLIKVKQDGKLILCDNEAYVENELPEEVDLVVSSSGSTGSPKGIAHRSLSFWLNAISVKERIQEENYESVTFLKPYLVSAFSHFLVHIISDSRLNFLDFNRLNSLGELFKRNHTMAIVGSPVHIISSYKNVPDAAKPLFVYSSGDFLHSNIIEKFISRWPEIIVFKVYGLAELAGRFFINRIDSQTALEDYDNVGEPLSVYEYKLDDGELLVQSKNQFLGYFEGSKFYQSKGFHPTGDMVQLDGKGKVVLTGRKSDEYKVGGNKVSVKFLEGKIAKVLKSLSFVLIPEKHEMFGNLLVMVVETTEDISRMELISLLKKSLETSELPHKFCKIEKFPIGQSAKIDRQCLISKVKDLELIR